MRERISLIAALGASGLGVALFFLAANAPDVAITQVLVETLTVLFLALVLRDASPMTRVDALAPMVRSFRFWVAAAFGVSVAAALAMAVGQTMPGDIAQWYLANSVPGGHGRNVVNVILVDFRALDTLGEILVVALAALGAAVLLRDSGRSALRSGGPDSFGSVFLRQGLRPLAGLLLLVSLVLLWRGHNLPGGGFIGGLVAASGVALVALGFGVTAARQVLRLPPATFVGIGLGIAVGAGVLGLLAGEPFLSGLWMGAASLPLGSPLLFDVGVFLTVFGAILHMLFRLLAKEI
jgi:multicomponent Na+:H+ antiporter subunit A